MSLPAKAAPNKIDFNHSSFSSASTASQVGNLQSISEKEETESELDFELELLSVVLPFFSAYNTISSYSNFSRLDLEINTSASSPVYLLNANFRI